MREPQLTFCFITEGLPFHGKTVYEQGLGGSETALHYMSLELAKRGHKVYVFCNCPKPGDYEGVEFRHIKSLREAAGVLEFDVTIVSRFLQYATGNLKTKSMYLWLHDMPAAEKNFFMTSLVRTDECFVMSEFQKKCYEEYAKEATGMFYVTKNGVDVNWILRQRKKFEKRKNRKRLIYASRPERGLLTLLRDIWPKLHLSDPELELVISGYDIFGIRVPDEVQQLYNQCTALIEQLPNVSHAGTLKKDDYYALLATSGLMVYPTDFPEISCINAMETMLAGCPLITSNRYALSETAAKGAILIDEPYGTDAYIEKFIFSVVRLVTADAEYKRLQQEGKEWIVNNYSWSAVADQWLERFYHNFNKRAIDNPIGIAREFASKGDSVSLGYYINSLPSDKLQASIRETVEEEYPYLQEPVKEECFHQFPEPDDAPIKPSMRLQLMFEKLGAVKNSGHSMKRILVHCCPKVCDLVEEKIKEFFEPEVLTVASCNDDLATDLGTYDVIVLDEVLEENPSAKVLENYLESFGASETVFIVTFMQGRWMNVSGTVGVDGYNTVFEQRDVLELFKKVNPLDLSYVACGINWCDELIGYWAVTCKVKQGQKFGDIDYEYKFLTARPRSRISCGMIVKNAEDDLSRCLKSVRGLVEELIIVDTGSDDTTVEIAKRFADKVVEIEWPEDFSAARNETLKHATGDWYFWIDADEVLVGGKNMRKYTDTVLYNGFVVRQNHLMLDFEAKPDVPVRLLRNDRGYKFYGVIHEHCEQEMDEPITPAMVCRDVDIAHYGYVVEGVRRWKCQKRNLNLLAKDRRLNPNRKLGLVLVMRDYINMTNWSIEAGGGQQITEDAVKYLRACVGIFRSTVTKDMRIYQLAEPLYQQALAVLGKFGVPITEDYPLPPFEAGTVLAAGYGGLQIPENGAAQPERRWFATQEEYQDWMREKLQELGEQLSNPGRRV